MDTIKKTVTIPEDHRLRIEVDIPPRIPAGEAEILLVISPVQRDRRRSDLAALAGILSKSPIFSRDPVAVQRELRDEWD